LLLHRDVVSDYFRSLASWIEIGEPLRRRRDTADWPARQIIFHGQRFDLAAALDLRH
jgi:hypothetical protein